MFVCSNTSSEETYSVSFALFPLPNACEFCLFPLLVFITYYLLSNFEDTVTCKVHMPVWNFDPCSLWSLLWMYRPPDEFQSPHWPVSLRLRLLMHMLGIRYSTGTKWCCFTSPYQWSMCEFVRIPSEGRMLNAVEQQRVFEKYLMAHALAFILFTPLRLSSKANVSGSCLPSQNNSCIDFRRNMHIPFLLGYSPLWAVCASKIIKDISRFTDGWARVINTSIDSQMPRVGPILWKLTHVT